MTEPQIVVRDLSKTYRVPEREEGLLASLKSLVRRDYRDVEAVREISFAVEDGEMVGFIGPNGAGKTTTLKMLSGLLHPTGGVARVMGFTPWQRKHDYLRRISMVLGNKSQMLWDIPPMDSFRVLGEIYQVPPTEFERTLDELIELLDMRELLTKPVRNFSLGERMKCELVAGLLHRSAVMNALLLRPLSPVFDALSSEVAGKVVYMTFVIPVTVILALVLKPELHLTWRNALAFVPALALAWALRFFWGYWLALLAFWATRADALLALQDALIFLLAGQVAPVALLPDWLGRIARVLPFRYMVGFPVEVLTGQVDAAGLLNGFIAQGVWLLIAVVLFLVMWHKGVKQYSAVGG